MTSIFSRIIAGEIPGRFVWEDPHCVAFLTIAPLTPGHALVVPREEIEQWTDASSELFTHLTRVAQIIGRAQQQEWKSPRIGLLAQGFEVAHLHLHVWPASSTADFDIDRADHDPSPERMDDDAARLRDRLRSMGHGSHVPDGKH
ncbi:Diadenosine tetraphosphate (Ap4A) hydrolase [Austwickia chelonae]|uniref:HIT family protein n=1 Tax=Austwickia chelonae NBRC 105200 TaxID=1184607 RepID=K6W652_9MICO|nr:HIT family protein [Austwickia chelonae]GAB77307.1 HIT family protein [Austwickia chelonae NBRC 105200]SEW07460.1 Diadenosine tetraphosphate (Ap4A) hydrolase [Austwickia chelonae]